MKLVLKGGSGVNKDLLPSELTLDYFSDSNNMRFRNGFPEKMGGIAEIMTSPSITSYALFPYQITTARYLIEAGIGKVYAHDGTTRTQITRIPPAKTVSSLVDTGGGGSSRTLTTSTAHGLSTGDRVTVYGCTGATADDYNAENVSITVTSTTVFTYAGGGADAPAASAGSPAYTVLTASSNVDFTGAIDDKWTGGHLAGVLILNNPVDGLVYWTGSTSTDLRQFVIPTYVADVGRPFGEWFIQLAPTQSSVKYPRRVLWSAGAEPGSLPTSFDAAASNDAGTFELDDTNGFCVDGLGWGDVFWIYKTDERYSMRWIGGNDVFDFQPVGDNSGLLARNCIANTPKGQVFVTPGGDIRIHSGGQSQSLSKGRFLTYLAGDWDTTYKTRGFMAVNENANEVWFYYPRSGSQVCNGAIVWNYEDNTMYSVQNGLSVTAGTQGLLPTTIATSNRMVIATSTPKLGLVDSGTTYLGATITATLERTGIHGDDFDSVKTLHASRIQADATAANVASVYHGSAMTADATPTYGSAITHTQGTTNKCNGFATGGRFMAWKLSTTATDWKQRTVEMEFNREGDY